MWQHLLRVLLTLLTISPSPPLENRITPQFGRHRKVNAVTVYIFTVIGQCVFLFCCKIWQASGHFRVLELIGNDLCIRIIFISNTTLLALCCSNAERPHKEQITRKSSLIGCTKGHRAASQLWCVDAPASEKRLDRLLRRESVGTMSQAHVVC